MKCSKCGKEITGNDKFCMYCGAEIKQPEPVKTYQTQYQSQPQQSASQTQYNYSSTQQTTTQNQSQYTARPKYEDPSMPNLADGEYKITSYLCSQLKFPKCEGSVTVTNKRLIFHGVGGGFSDNRIVQEVGIQEVRGISSYYGLHIYWGKLIFGIILTLIGFTAFSAMAELSSYGGYGSSSSDSNLFMVLVLAVGIYLIVTAFRKAYFLNVYTRAMSAGIEIGNGANTLLGNSAVFSIVGAPNRETNKMMKELGSMVMEIQKYNEQ